MRTRRTVAIVLSAVVLAQGRLVHAATDTSFTVAVYNVENWNSIERHGKPAQPKPAQEKQGVWNVIHAIRPDVIGFEEMGKEHDLTEVRNGLKQRGLDYPFSEWIECADKDRHVALLSRFPIAQRFSRTDYTYDLDGKTHRIQRGFLDVRIQVNDQVSFRAIVAHLKSKRKSDEGDQAKMRLEEARLLRAHVGKALKDDPQLNLIAMGDFNDTPESEPIRTLIGESPFALFDLMPVDSHGGHDTHFWKAQNEFSRIDYLITSPAMHERLVKDSARVADVENWDKASDHRAVYASFRWGSPAGATAAPATSFLNDRRFWLIVLNLVALCAVAGVTIYFARRSHLSAS